MTRPTRTPDDVRRNPTKGDVPSIEQQIAELKAAGWQKITRVLWKAPAGSGCAGYFLGPYGAWKAMRKHVAQPREGGEGNVD